MSSLTIANSKNKDLVLMEILPEERQLMDIGMMEAIIDNSTCHTVFAPDGKIIAIMGFHELWAGVIEVFVIPSVHLPKYGKTIVRLAKTHLSNLFKVLDIHRIQSASRATPQIDKWMQVLGFTCEGTMVGYSPGGTDYRMWARWD